MQVPDFSTLTIEQKIGQLFFIGIPVDRVDETTRNILNNVRPGGICLFARNIKTAEQVHELLEELRDLSDIEPFFSIDQEGGLVDRLRRVLRPMSAASRLISPESASKQAEIIARSLRAMGFNMDFAPVVDVIDARRAAFSNGLHSRAYGSSAAEVVEIAGAFLNMLQSNGIIGCIKHFPGLGASEADSHDELPTVSISHEEFESVDLYPFRHLISSGGVQAVMVAHAVYPNLDLQASDRDGKLLPSSLNFNFVTKLLRNQVGFDGLVLTDDLEMGAIVKNFGIGEAAVLAILAGHDMVAICSGLDPIHEAHSAITDAVASGRITRERIDQSIARIARLKLKIQPPIDLDLDGVSGLSLEIEALNREIA